MLFCLSNMLLHSLTAFVQTQAHNCWPNHKWTMQSVHLLWDCVDTIDYTWNGVFTGKRIPLLHSCQRSDIIAGQIAGYSASALGPLVA
jgi:hypothetical protein